MKLPGRFGSGLRDRGPVLMTVAAALISISTLAYGPGSLTSHASAQTSPSGAAAASATTLGTIAPSAPQARNRAGLLQIIGHRAGSDWGPPNTLSTIAHAIGAGADAIEFDVHFTSDQHAVVFHDTTLDQTTSCSGPIRLITFAKLANCRVGSNEHVPTLDAVLTQLANSPVKSYVHVKVADTPAQARQIMTAINAHHLNDPARLTVIGSSSQILEQMRAAGAKRLGLVFDTAAGWHAPYKVLVVFDTQVTPALVADAQRRGHFVIVVQDHPATLAQIASLHVDGFMANRLGDALRTVANLPAPPSDDRAPIEPQVGTRARHSSAKGTDDA